MYADLLFPLNVYAYLLEAREGSAGYLHFGLFRQPGMRMLAAQECSTQLLLAQMPAPPARVLEVGAGFGTLSRILDFIGYPVTAINPDAAQIAVSRARGVPEGAIRQARLEDFATDQQFDLMLLQEVSQYIPVAALFARASELLAPGGQILLMDEMRSRIEVESTLHCHATYLEQAARHGFVVRVDRDISQEALPTVDYLLAGLAELREAICREVGVSAEQVAQLEAALYDYQAKYRDGSYIYQLMKFEKAV